MTATDIMSSMTWFNNSAEPLGEDRDWELDYHIEEALRLLDKEKDFDVFI